MFDATTVSKIQSDIVSAYEELAEKYDQLIDHKPHNAYYDRPNTLALLPEVQGKVILDAACGPGKYAEILLSKGAYITGFDISAKMVDLAKKRNAGQGNFFVHDFSKSLDMLEDRSFDMVLCALALHYVPDWTLTIKEFCRVLKPGGILVISIEHPFFEYNFFKSTNYFNIEHVACVWKGFGNPVNINSFRRPLSECLLPLTDNGFYIDKIVEPRPVKEFEQLDPRHFKELNEFPGFLCIRAVKRSS
jgi:ubiquinone/menaquinone biosynthesis C-methylase UbiE